MGLIYSSAESGELMIALTKNLASGKEAIDQLKAGSQQVVSAVDGHTLSGSAYTAATGLFSECILPTITRVTTSVETIEQELQKYTAADSFISSEGYLDEDNLSQQLAIKKAMKLSVDVTSAFVKSQTRTNLITSVLDAVFDFQKNLRQMSENLQQDMDELDEKLRKLQHFSSETSSLFSSSLSDLKLAMQGVLVLNRITVNEDGTYTFPAGIDISWFREFKTVSNSARNAYDSALEELVDYDADGTIKDIDADKLQEWLVLFVQGKLTTAQVEALKTAMLILPGYIDELSELKDPANETLQKLAILQDVIGQGWSIFGFAYDQEGEHFYTKQDSMQSWFGFGDMFDEVGPLLGMDLDTEVVQFMYGGKEYRFQVWKGTYGSGTMVGGEQGWYVYDSHSPIQYTQNMIADGLGQSDWVPVAAPEDRIRMINTLYNETTNKRITAPSDTAKYAPEGAYWNLDTTALHPGYTKSNIYTEGKLYIDDEGLRNETYEQLKASGAFSNVRISGNKVMYTWKD
ncbi:DUF4474 domain-containing protein [Erwinia sp. CPCC 100877]|nr:DUF4474 domain-containing protein [Erwinia sp. CPCC 100877]